jgi:hypothetical protein
LGGKEICMTNGQKARERAFLTEAVSLEPLLFTGPIQDSERPDFLMQAAGTTIGIEIMEYARGQHTGESAMRRSEAAQKQLANMAHQAFKANHAEPIFVTLHCNPYEAPAKAELQRLVSILVDIVGQHIPQELYAKIKLDYDDLEGTGLQSFVYSINVQRVRDDRGDGWGVMSADFISTTAEELQGIINFKNPKVPDYLTRCDKIWLFIVAESFLDLSGNISFSEDVLQHRYTTSFERVLFYDRATKRVHLLKT